jgi:hypothetical protein
MNQKQILLACGVCLLSSEDLALVVPGTLLLVVAASLPNLFEKINAWGSNRNNYDRQHNKDRKR